LGRITETFTRLTEAGKKGFIPFITAGDPDLETSQQLMIELARAGASVIELGVPFSDPMADGPVIQRASMRALRHNFGIAEILQTASAARKKVDTPIVLFSYFNPLLQFGISRLASEAKAAGVDAVLVTDLIPEEAQEVSDTLARSGLDMIFLVAPTSTDDRLQMVAQKASGFIYAVSRTGVTGQTDSVSDAAAELVRRVKTYSKLPVAVGFGISTPEQVREVWSYADAAVVGSAIVAEIEKHSGSPSLVEKVGEFARSLTA